MSGMRRKAGLLGPHIDGFGAWLLLRGYTPATVRGMLKVAGRLGLWLPAQGLTVTALDEQRMADFVATRTVAGHRRSPGVRGMAPLLEYLRQAGAVPAVEPAPPTPLGELLDDYGRWLVRERAWPRPPCCAI